MDFIRKISAVGCRMSSATSVLSSLYSASLPEQFSESMPNTRWIWLRSLIYNGTNAGGQARAYRWLMGALAFVAVMAAAYAWSRQQTLEARNKLNESDKRVLQLQKVLSVLDANVNRAASQELVIRNQLQQPNQPASERDELRKRLEQVVKEKNQLETQRADAEREARTEAVIRAQLQQRANVQHSDLALAQKHITDLELSLKKAQDDAKKAQHEATQSFSEITELRAKNQELQEQFIAPAVSSVSRDDDKELERYRNAADGGDPLAIYAVVLMYSQARGSRTADVKAAELYRKAADAGDPLAMIELALMYEFGRGGLPRDKATAMELFQKAAAFTGNATAMNLVANAMEYLAVAYSYENGFGILGKNRARAEQLREKSAEFHSQP